MAISIELTKEKNCVYAYKKNLFSFDIRDEKWKIMKSCYRT